MKVVSEKPPIFLGLSDKDIWERSCDHEIFEIDNENKWFYSPRTGETIHFSKIENES